MTKIIYIYMYIWGWRKS